MNPAKNSSAAGVQELARKHGVSTEAVEVLREALHRGGGRMAQFSHPELGGSVQWMNGMLMLGDMSNHALKAKVDALARDVAAMAGTRDAEGPAAGARREDPRWPETKPWWPAEFGRPASSGAQNDSRYAYFPEEEALVVQRQGRTTVYDTTGFALHGFGQQQGMPGAADVPSLLGAVDLARLPVRQTKDTPHR